MSAFTPADHAAPGDGGEGPGSNLFLEAARSRNRSRPPVWFMRQAGRYLPAYREIRRRHTFVEMCTSPDLAFEVSLLPYREFGVDAVIVFYDILFPAEAMGAPLEYAGEGPRFLRTIRSRRDVEALAEPDPRTALPAILETLRRLRAALPPETAVLGFAGAPFTVAAYLVEGSFRQSGERVRRMLYEEPGLLDALLEKIARVTADYVEAQVEAGADAVQLFDTWAGLLAPAEYRRFARAYVEPALERLRSAGAPSILYVRDASHLLEDLAAAGADVLSLDWRVDLAATRARFGLRFALQGNLDPAALFAPPEEVAKRVEALLASLRGDPGFIVNLGHGILPDTPLAGVRAFVDTVRRLSTGGGSAAEVRTPPK